MTIKPNTPEEMAALVRLPVGTKLKITKLMTGSSVAALMNGEWLFNAYRYDVPEPIRVHVRDVSVMLTSDPPKRQSVYVLSFSYTDSDVSDAVIAALSNTVIEGRKVEVVK